MLLWDKYQQMAGKTRRMFLLIYARERVRKKLKLRIGSCRRCGACCKLAFECPAYDESDGSPKCLIYEDRPGICSLFPIDKRDIKERDMLKPKIKCGFSFIPLSQCCANPADAESLWRKEIKRPSMLTGTFVIARCSLTRLLFPRSSRWRIGHKGRHTRYHSLPPLLKVR